MIKHNLFWPSVALGIAALCFTARAAEPESLAQREARLAAAFKKAPEVQTLEELAMVREKAGLFNKAEATWGLLVSRYGAQESSYSDDKKRLTYAQLAVWMRHRLTRRRNLARRGKASSQQYRRAWYARNNYVENPPVTHLHAYRDIDLDGDGIEEVVYYGRSGPLGKGRRNSMSIARWDGIDRFRPIWSQDGRQPVEVEYKEGDDFGELVLVFTQESDDVMTLYFNGRSFISIYHSV